MTSSDKAGLSVLYLNSRRIKSCTRTRNKIQQLQAIVSLRDFDIVAITETWLVRDNEILPQCYTVYRRNRQDVHADKEAVVELFVFEIMCSHAEGEILIYQMLYIIILLS